MKRSTGTRGGAVVLGAIALIAVLGDGAGSAQPAHYPASVTLYSTTENANLRVSCRPLSSERIRCDMVQTMVVVHRERAAAEVEPEVLEGWQGFPYCEAATNPERQPTQMRRAGQEAVNRRHAAACERARRPCSGRVACGERWTEAHAIAGPRCGLMPVTFSKDFRRVGTRRWVAATRSRACPVETQFTLEAAGSGWRYEQRTHATGRIDPDDLVCGGQRDSRTAAYASGAPPVLRLECAELHLGLPL